LIESLYEDIEIFLEDDIYKHLPLIKYLKNIKDKGDFSSSLDNYLLISDIDVEVIIKLIATNSDYKGKKFKMIADRIHFREFPCIYEIDYFRCDEVGIEIDKFKANNLDIEPWQINLNNRQFNTYEDNKNNNNKIYVIDNDKNIKSIDHLSIPIFSMMNKNEVNPILIIDKEIDDKPSVKELRERRLFKFFCA